MERPQHARAVTGRATREPMLDYRKVALCELDRPVMGGSLGPTSP